jgi:NADH-quinone oxidoreductase subunit C
MTFEEIHQRLAARFAGGGSAADGRSPEGAASTIGPLAPAKMDPFAVVPAADIVAICRFLKDDPDLAFDCLMNLSAVDWPKKNQIEVVYHLWSYAKRHSFILKVQLDRAAPSIASIESVWKSADWLEREQYDLLGVIFTGHPDLRRIMLPDDWVGFPLRKDYKEQASWHNITTTRENSLEGYVKLDEFRKKAAEAAAAEAATAAKKEVLQ